MDHFDLVDSVLVKYLRDVNDIRWTNDPRDVFLRAQLDHFGLNWVRTLRSEEEYAVWAEHRCAKVRIGRSTTPVRLEIRFEPGCEAAWELQHRVIAHPNNAQISLTECRGRLNEKVRHKRKLFESAMECVDRQGVTRWILDEEYRQATYVEEKI